MSYNLIAEGTLDLVALAHLSTRFEMIEVFPLPLTDADEAIGIAIPRTRANDQAVIELERLLDAIGDGARVYDLHSGDEIAGEADRDALAERIVGG